MHAWLPYCGHAPAPGDWLMRWNFAPELVAPLLALLAVALLRPDRLRRSATIGFVGTFAFLFISPFCALGSALFTVRVVHDVILVTVLAPLAMAALNLRHSRVRGSLAIWTALHAVTFWLWHSPSIYESAMSNDAVFWLMQTSLVATAALWWARVLQAPALSAVPALLSTMVAMGSLGALLVFIPRALYAPHWLTVQSWGLVPLEDQQIAGTIMWAPASLVYLFAALAILYRALARPAPA